MLDSKSPEKENIARGMINVVVMVYKMVAVNPNHVKLVHGSHL